MDNTFTPGPWNINELGEIEAGRFILGIVYCADGGDETSANGRLIAAVTDLLEALQEITKAYGEMIESEFSTDPAEAPCYLKAKAAISKALNK
jgi:hypothetical protein